MCSIRTARSNVSRDAQIDIATSDGGGRSSRPDVRRRPIRIHCQASRKSHNVRAAIPLHANPCGCVVEEGKTRPITVLHVGIVHQDRARRFGPEDTVRQRIAGRVQVVRDRCSGESETIVDSELGRIWIVVPFPLWAETCAREAVHPSERCQQIGQIL